MTAERYRTGVVGCGEIARMRADSLQSHPQVELVAGADTDPDTLAAFAAEYDLSEAYSDHTEMLAAVDLDVVWICTWHGTHAEITIDAAEAGVDGIYCVKPMATSLGEAADMLDAAERNDAKLVVGHGRRYSAVNERARELIEAGRIGTPQVALARTGDGLLNWGTHLIDHARYLLGDPETEWVLGQVERTTDRHERAEPIEDLCGGQVCFADGTRLTFECDLPPPGLDADANALAVYGTAGHVLPEGDRLTVFDDDGETTFAPESDRSGDGMFDELFEWIAGERDTHRCSGGQAYRTMEIMMAIYESARTRGVVRPPMETRANPLKVMLEAGELPLEHPGAYDIRLPYASQR